MASGGGGSAVSSSPPSGPPVKVVAATEAATVSAGTARVDMVIGADFSGLPDQSGGQPGTQSGDQSGAGNGSFRVTATGAFDLAHKLASLDMDLGSIAGGRHIKVFVDGTTAYVSTSGLGLAGSKPWIKVPAGSNGTDFSSLTSTAFSGPQVLSKLTDVTVVGTDMVHGAATTHYRGTLDLGTALQQLGTGGSGLSQLGQLGQSVQSALAGTTIPVDAWIDGHNRLRRFTMAMDLAPMLKAIMGGLSGLGGSNGSSRATAVPANLKAVLSIDMSLYDFGANLDLTPPPADQVGPPPSNFRIPGLTGGSGSGTGSGA